MGLLEEDGDDAKLLAGGQSLILAMRFRLSLPEVLIDINGLTDLEYVRESGNHLAIGAMTREVDLEDSALVRDKYSMLADATRVVADPIELSHITDRDFYLKGRNASSPDGKIIAFRQSRPRAHWCR